MKSFEELKINPQIKKAIAELGFVTPSPIQCETLPLLLGNNTDFLGLAATGTGKTAAFSIPLLQKIDTSKKAVQALILCPTRELAIQVSGQINLMGKYIGVKSVPIYGGASFGDQMHGLKKGATVVVGTPGRVIDHMQRGTLKLDQVGTLVLDEADEMISMGFKESIEAIIEAMTLNFANIWLFSATMDKGVSKVADQYLKNPKRVQVNQTEVLSSTVQQFYYATHESNKQEVLCKLMDSAESFYGLIFCQTKALVADVTDYLKSRKYAADCLHGDMDQTARERTMRAFRERKITILICTDVASRGLDVKDISHVINYSLPRELENYVHRIGRTARSGKAGIAMSLVTPSHRGLISRIERITKSKMIEGKIPGRKEVGIKKVSLLLEGFKNASAFKRAIELFDTTWKEELSKMSNEEIAGRFLTLMHPEIFTEAPSEKSSIKPDRLDLPREGRFNRGDRGGYRGGDRGGDRGDRRQGRGGDRPRGNRY